MSQVNNQQSSTYKPFLSWQSPWRYLEGDTGYLRIVDVTENGIGCYYGTVSDPIQTEQFTNLDNQPLYWKDGEIGGEMTTDPVESGVSPIPVLVYVYEVKQAAAVTFEEVTRDWGTGFMPVIELGGGDPAGNKKARIYKDDTAFRIEYDRAPEDEEEEGETYFFEIGDEGIKTYPELTNSHLILNRQPVPTDAEGLAENDVVLVYNPNQPLV